MVSINRENPRETMASIMRAAGLHPSLVHAHLKTGLLVAEGSPHSEAERKEWIDAVNEWYDANDTEDSHA